MRFPDPSNRVQSLPRPALKDLADLPLQQQQATSDLASAQVIRRAQRRDLVPHRLQALAELLLGERALPADRSGRWSTNRVHSAPQCDRRYCPPGVQPGSAGAGCR